jgi:DNA-binding NarL/FixJ family response regulator
MDIKIILVDDHDVVRAGIRAIVDKLGRGISIIGEASHGRELLALEEKKKADVFIIDIAMPEINGIETVEKLLKSHPNSKIIVLSMYNDRNLVERAFKCGVKGYVLKENATEEIVRAIREVHGGRYYLSPGISGFVVEGFISRGSKDGPDGGGNRLTDRQKEVLRLICEGHTEKEIARRLGLSTYTIHAHKANIMGLLGVHTKAGLIRYAIKEGIILPQSCRVFVPAESRAGVDSSKKQRN